jgi:hypothetical protein
MIAQLIRQGCFHCLHRSKKQEEEIDLDCDTGRAAYLESKAATPMTKNAMEINKPWQKRFDEL